MVQDEVKVRVGYACINLSLKDSFKNFRLASVEKQDKEKIIQVIWHNIRLLKTIIDYNIKHNIYVYRVTSDLIPFCTLPYVRSIYEEYVIQNEEMQGHFNAIRELVRAYKLRLSIHPSQFNVLASPREDVVKHSIEEVNMQTRWIKELNGQNVVLHVGGSYGNKLEALKRFRSNISYVDTKLISIENDDKTYSAYEIYELCKELGIKWIYDYHHDRCHPSDEIDIYKIIRDYPPDKYHLSTGATAFNARSHADCISREDYIAFTKLLARSYIKEADVIFEAKLKNKAITEILVPCSSGFWKLKEE